LCKTYFTLEYTFWKHIFYAFLNCELLFNRKMAVLRFVAPHGLLAVHQHFRCTCHLHQHSTYNMGYNPQDSHHHTHCDLRFS
jgi:hypothetical protein